MREVGGLRPSPEEPSVWLPTKPDLIEVKFIGMDTTQRPGETYVFEDPDLPLLVFGQLSLLRRGRPVTVEGITIPVPRPAGLLLEKLVTDRTGVKGDRDLLMALALLLLCEPADIHELEESYQRLPAELRYAARSSLASLSLLGPMASMPDPAPHRALVAALVARLERAEPAT